MIAGLMLGLMTLAAAMVFMVLAQRGGGRGLMGGIGGGGGSVLGIRTAGVMTWATVALFVLFVGLAIGLNFWLR